MYFSPLSCYPVPFRPNYPPQYPILKHHLFYSLILSDQVQHSFIVSVFWFLR
jgi:hypothetical protein